MTPSRLALARLGLIVAAVVAIRAPAVRVDILNEDEALYATTAAAMAEGEPIYRAGVESKPPGVFYLYEAGFAIVGRYNMRGLHALTMLWVLATTLLVGALARRATRRDADADGAADQAQAPPERVIDVGVIASLLYAGFTIVEEPAVLATQCELLFSLPLALAAWLVLDGRGLPPSGSAAAWQRGSIEARGARPLGGFARFLLAGLLCGAATLIKPTAVSLPVAISGWLVFRRVLLRGPDRFVVDAARIVTLWAGFAAAWLAAAAYFSHLGVWDDLVYWAFRWTLGTYIPTGTSHSPWLWRFGFGFGMWAALTTILWIFAVLATRANLAERKALAPASAATDATWLLIAWVICSTALTFLGGRFFDHYFPAVIPSLAALAATAFAARRKLPRWRRALAIGALVPIVACWLGAWQFSTTMRWVGDARRPYDEIADYIDAHTAPTDRVFVWGYFPLIYVAADRLAATRFVGCHYLTGYAAIGLGQDLPPEIEDHLGIPHGFETLVTELEMYKPPLLIDTSPADLHHWRRYPISRYPTLAAYVAANYAPEATVQGAVIYRRHAREAP